MTDFQFAPEALADPTPAAGLLISRNPLIVWGPNGPDWRCGPGSSLARHVGNRRAYFLFSLTFSRDSVAVIENDAAAIEELRKEFPEHRHVMLCNTRQELQLAAGRNINAILCSTMALVNETIFRIQPNQPKLFDAIYNAALTKFKKHELCRDVSGLGLLYHWFHAAPAQRANIENEYRALLPHAKFINGFDKDYRLLNAHQIADWLNRAEVGLCLSEVEGATTAAVEYMLCGLPVVTTPSKGGRDRIFDPTVTLTVDPTPAAVARGVRTVIERQIEPHRVRFAAQATLKPDRVRLLRLIAAIYEKENVPFPDQADWRHLFRHGPWPQKSVGRLLSETPIAERSAVR